MPRPPSRDPSIIYFLRPHVLYADDIKTKRGRGVHVDAVREVPPTGTRDPDVSCPSTASAAHDTWVSFPLLCLTRAARTIGLHVGASMLVAQKEAARTAAIREAYSRVETMRFRATARAARVNHPSQAPRRFETLEVCNGELSFTPSQPGGETRNSVARCHALLCPALHCLRQHRIPFRNKKKTAEAVHDCVCVPDFC